MAGIHAEIKSQLGERLYLSQFKKYTRRKKTTLSNFSNFIKLYMYLQNVCRIQKERKKKGLTKLIRWFGNVTDQKESVREATIVSWLP